MKVGESLMWMDTQYLVVHFKKIVKHTTNIISKMFLSIELNHFYKLEKCVLAFIVIVISVFLMLIGHSGALSAQSIPTQFNPQQVTISGTLHMYLVSPQKVSI